jgi:hypothetical protein
VKDLEEEASLTDWVHAKARCEVVVGLEERMQISA